MVHNITIDIVLVTMNLFIQVTLFSNMQLQIQFLFKTVHDTVSIYVAIAKSQTLSIVEKQSIAVPLDNRFLARLD